MCRGCGLPADAVSFRTALRHPHQYACLMRFEYLKAAIVAAWIVGIGALAVFSNMTSIGGWILIAGLALLPPVVILRLWGPPAETISESIRDVKR